MQKNIHYNFFSKICRLVLENLALFMGFPYEISPQLWVTILGHPTHISTLKTGKLPPPPPRILHKQKSAPEYSFNHSFLPLYCINITSGLCSQANNFIETRFTKLQ